MGAHIVLHTARGRSNASVARETGLHLDSVRKWRGRFAGGGLSGSATIVLRRSLSSATLQAAQAKAPDGQLPAKARTPFSR
ncbi:MULTISPECIES: helix-turn-helix domain-containing protein [Streptomyces]|uniref:Helix-turn-helix domain-containing protein n=2 Tax=Streptomyces rimosus subsp. rimosus TaxID=132474 RepID=L8F036_STRR1|nr:MULTISPECIES: helix-turn-helix domain-containing protein [Streptomyces]KOG75641.1 hypothetical protein ADK78_12500 [Kitasatospora aureofaciens]MYT41895.1 helix-turn-helix domain-containing protein [Streptomyces sp. SID5471]KOT46376.1 hypothetical protein ADK42_00925 [Streptomyces rimosus subsp. rimosus]KOT47593.1 hypothetical protein ADK84_00920 [Streptomyces sp. NRRL WC-3701]KOT61877.1 hypothetical protein ADK44_14300 [Streptomyces rimosus subsp. rimosus]